MSNTKISRLSDDEITRRATTAGDIIETAILALEKVNGAEDSYVAGALRQASNMIYEIQTRYEEKDERY